MQGTGGSIFSCPILACALLPLAMPPLGEGQKMWELPLL